MSDGIPGTPGIGIVVGADDIAGSQYQRIKLIHGADGVNAGDVCQANPLPIVNGLMPTERLLRLPISVASLGNNTIIPASALNYARIYGILLFATTAVGVYIGDTDSLWTGSMGLIAGVGLYLPPMADPYFKTTNVNRNVVLQLTSAIGVGGIVWYTLAP